MSRKFIIIIIPIIIFAQWQIQIVDTHGGAGASLSLDSQGNPYISYGDPDSSFLKCAQFSNSNWNIMIVDSLIVRYGWPIASLCLDKNNIPLIAYYYEDNEDLRVAFWYDSTWGITTVDSSGRTGFSPSIITDTAGTLHISYFTRDFYDLRYSYGDTSGWAIDVIDTANIRCSLSSLDLDISSNPHITYIQLLGNSQGCVKYAKKQGGTWYIASFDSNETPLPGAIATDSLSHPHIVYSVMHSIVKYGHWNGSEWIIEEVDSVPRQVTCVDIALDGNGIPHIVYSIDEMGIWYAYKTPGGSWQKEQVINGIFGQVSLALDRTDTPHIAFHDNRTFYAKRSQTNIEHRKSFFPENLITLYPNPTRTIVGIRFSGISNDIKALSVFDVSGRVVRNLSALLFNPGDAVNWDLCDECGYRVEPGVYFLIAKLSTMLINRKIIVVR